MRGDARRRGASATGPARSVPQGPPQPWVAEGAERPAQPEPRARGKVCF